MRVACFCGEVWETDDVEGSCPGCGRSASLPQKRDWHVTEDGLQQLVDEERYENRWRE